VDPGPDPVPSLGASPAIIRTTGAVLTEVEVASFAVSISVLTAAAAAILFAIQTVFAKLLITVAVVSVSILVYAATRTAVPVAIGASLTVFGVAHIPVIISVDLTT